jgi:hypothetical protein
MLGGDGQTVAGVPITPSSQPILVGWGGMSTIADTIKELQLASLDLLDPTNQQDLTFGASSLIGNHHVWDRLPFSSAARVLKMAQNTAAANNIGYTLDWYATGGNPQLLTQTTVPKYGNAQNWRGSTVTGTLTAITWKQTAFAPTPILPAGRYAILGAWVNTLTNYGLLRFRHADFGSFAPGFPVVDHITTGSTSNQARETMIGVEDGYQFVYLSNLYGIAAVPVFGVSTAGTGLNFELCALSTDAPTVTVNLAKVG